VARGQYQIDPETPAAKQLARVMAEIWMEFITTHSQEEIDAVVAKAEEHRQMSRRIRLQVRPVEQRTDEGSLTPGTR